MDRLVHNQPLLYFVRTVKTMNQNLLDAILFGMQWSIFENLISFLDYN